MGVHALKSARSRLNIVDAAIIVIVVLAVLFGVRHFAPSSSSGANAKTVSAQVTFISNPTSNWRQLAPRIAVGDPVQAVLSGTPYAFGTVSSLSVTRSLLSVPDASGQLHIVNDPANRKIQIEITVQASGGKTGPYTVNGNPLFLGEPLTVQAGPVSLTGFVSNVTSP